MSLKYFEKLLHDIQPLYNEINSKYSKTYLQGSSWYVGDDLNKWWQNCNNIRYFHLNKQKIIHIIEIIIAYAKNNQSLL